MTNNERKFICDANVLVSAALFVSSKPRQALEKVYDLGILLLSDAILLELKEVLVRSKFDKYITRAKREEFLVKLADTAQFIKILELINECRDKKDNKYLELAVSGKAECIITGDKDLLVLNPFRNTEILTIQEFLNKN